MLLHFLLTNVDARVLAIEGFHTGRAKLAAFFGVIQEGLEIEEIYEEDTDRTRREWVKEKDREREHATKRKKWLPMAILRRTKEEAS